METPDLQSHPFYNGGVVGALTDDNRPYLKDDGNWSLEGQAVGPTHRSLLLIVNRAEVFGFYPDWLRESFPQAIARSGCFVRSDALAWRGPVLGAADKWEIRVKAGNRHFYGLQGDDPGDYMEWGSGNPANPANELVATTGVLTVPGSVLPTPPPVSDLDARLGEMADNVAAEMALMTATSPEVWITQNPGEAGDILRLVVYRAFGQHFGVRELKSHAGRAASGIGQNGVTVQDELG